MDAGRNRMDEEMLFSLGRSSKVTLATTKPDDATSNQTSNERLEMSQSQACKYCEDFFESLKKPWLEFVLPGTLPGVLGSWIVACSAETEKTVTYYVRPPLSQFALPHGRVQHELHVQKWAIELPVYYGRYFRNTHDDAKKKAFVRFQKIKVPQLQSLDLNRNVPSIMSIPMGVATVPMGMEYRESKLQLDEKQLLWLKFYVACQTAAGLCIPETERNPQGIAEWLGQFKTGESRKPL
ncbi:hypothetical protein QFC22_003985 [Naganishia vaughanmartiniae]|uniref:Uncharacterized protein n=1 Tax=Naganishia vaughanmartiniae TaxID=1424756 RepID=A0ACC2X407_9TREE|nr:hypothetical protein QFC22_003985 [Naganishia vaughanmartiniae]